MCRHAVAHGGHVRTGLGDNPVLGGKQLSNAEQIAQVVEMAHRIGRSVATPAQARELLRSAPR
jgi:3-keto-5-aminohexanoate cleavage enzyme